MPGTRGRPADHEHHPGPRHYGCGHGGALVERLDYRSVRLHRWRERRDRRQCQLPHLVVTGWLTRRRDHPGGVGIHDNREVRGEAAAHPFRQAVEQRCRRGLDEQIGRDVHELRVPVGKRTVDRAQRLDRHAVDLEDLVPHEPEQVVAREADAELVDDHPVVPLEDVDRDHVTADRADPTGHRPKGSRSVGELDPDQVVPHRARVDGQCVRSVSGRLRTAAR